MRVWSSTTAGHYHLSPYSKCTRSVNQCSTRLLQLWLLLQRENSASIIFTIKSWKLPKCSINGRMAKQWSVNTMEYYAAMKSSQPKATIWTNPTMLSKEAKYKKSICYIILFIERTTTTTKKQKPSVLLEVRIVVIPEAPRGYQKGAVGWLVRSY